MWIKNEFWWNALFQISFWSVKNKKRIIPRFKHYKTSSNNQSSAFHHYMFWISSCNFLGFGCRTIIIMKIYLIIPKQITIIWQKYTKHARFRKLGHSRWQKMQSFDTVEIGQNNGKIRHQLLLLIPYKIGICWLLVKT